MKLRGRSANRLYNARSDFEAAAHTLTDICSITGAMFVLSGRSGGDGAVAAATLDVALVRACAQVKISRREASRCAIESCARGCICKLCASACAFGRSKLKREMKKEKRKFCVGNIVVLEKAGASASEFNLLSLSFSFSFESVCVLLLLLVWLANVIITDQARANENWLLSGCAQTSLITPLPSSLMKRDTSKANPKGEL